MQFHSGSLDIFSRDRLDTVSETGVILLNNLSISPGNLRIVQSQESPSMMGFCGDLKSKNWVISLCKAPICNEMSSVV